MKNMKNLAQQVIAVIFDYDGEGLPKDYFKLFQTLEKESVSNEKIGKIYESITCLIESVEREGEKVHQRGLRNTAVDTVASNPDIRDNINFARRLIGLSSLPSKTPPNVHKRLIEPLSAIRDCRGLNEIYYGFLNLVKELSNAFGLPKESWGMAKKFQEHEIILYNLPEYRDHFIHQVHIFCWATTL